MFEEDKLDQFIRKLVDDSKRGKVTWDRAKAHEVERNDSIGPLYYTAIGDKYLLAYRSQYRSWIDGENFEWVKDITLEFTDRSFVTAWKIPENRLRYELMETIELKVSNIDLIIDNYLSG